MSTIEQLLAELQTAITTEKQTAEEQIENLRKLNEEQQEELQKCKSRLDQDQLNFKYSTLLDTYNEAEYENTKLRKENGELMKKHADLVEHQQNQQGQYDQLRSQCIEALNENRQLRLRLAQPYETFSFIPRHTHSPTHGLNQMRFLKDFQ